MRAAADAQAMTPAEINERAAEMHRERRKNWTSSELEDAQEKRHEYHRQIANPVRRFKAKATNRGMSSAEMHRKVGDFQKAKKEALRTGDGVEDADNILSL